MKRIGILAGAMGASILKSLAGFGHSVSIDRDRPVSSKRRRVTANARMKRGSKYMPHQGAKERERAARSYMQRFFPIAGPIQTDPVRLRSAPIVQVMSKRDYYAGPF